MDEKQRRKAVGRRVEMLRNDLDWTQEELGERVGLAKSTISGIETGAHGISRSADRLAKALGTTTDYLFGLTDNPLPPDDEEEDEPRAANPVREALHVEIDQADEIDQQVLYQMAVTLRLARERRRTQRVIE